MIIFLTNCLIHKMSENSERISVTVSQNMMFSDVLFSLSESPKPRDNLLVYYDILQRQAAKLHN